MLREKKTLVNNASFMPYMGPHMRNYVKGSWGYVKYAFPPPDYINENTQYFITGDDEATASQLNDFVSLLDPGTYRVEQVQLLGDVFWLLDKDIVLELVNGIPGWWNFVGTNVATTESPRKSWSHGK